jgi:hypothetical protein
VDASTQKEAKHRYITEEARDESERSEDDCHNGKPLHDDIHDGSLHHGDFRDYDDFCTTLCVKIDYSNEVDESTTQETAAHLLCHSQIYHRQAAVLQ